MDTVGVYRFGFNGQERVDEVAGNGNHNTAKFWEYDPRAVKRWNTDPVPMPWESPYAINRSNPIWHNDPDGDCPTCDEMGTTGDYATGATTTDNGVPYMRTETGWDKVQNGGMMREATASASRGLSSNPIHRNMEMKGITSYGRPTRQTNWQGGMGKFGQDVMGLTTAGLGLALTPMAIGVSAPVLPELVGAKFWAGKAFISTFSQALTNNGNVNLVGVGADALLIPGVSDAMGAAFEVNFNMFNPMAGLSTRTLGRDKSFSEFGIQAGTSFLFSSRLKVLDAKVIKGNSWLMPMLYSPTQVGNYGLQRGILTATEGDEQ